jgi:hypothetical protein
MLEVFVLIWKKEHPEGIKKNSTDLRVGDIFKLLDDEGKIILNTLNGEWCLCEEIKESYGQIILKATPMPDFCNFH